MRFIFLDESGTSQHELVTVVAGVIVEADHQVAIAEAAISEALSTVPAQFRDNFVFHATDIWNNKRYREQWDFDSRLALMLRMMEIPRLFKMPIAIGNVRRSAGLELANTSKPDLTVAQFHHITAFMGCIGIVNTWMKKKLPTVEAGKVVAEDVPEMRWVLKHAHLFVEALEKAPLAPEMLRPTEDQIRRGVKPYPHNISTGLVRPSIHFAAKRDDPLLQIADACAFGFRRFLEERKFGLQFAEALTGEAVNIEDFRGPASFGVWDYQRIKPR